MAQPVSRHLSSEDPADTVPPMAGAGRQATPDGSAPAGPERSDDVEPGTLLAAAALVLSAFPVVAAGFSDRPGPYMVQTYLFWGDLPLMALGLLRLPDLVRRVLARRLDLVTAGVALVAALTVAWAFSPTLRGGLQVLRFLGVAAAVLEVGRASVTGRRLLAGTLAAFTAVQVVVALVQRITGGPVGLGSLGELADPLVPIGGADAPQGTLIHPYLLAGLAMVTIAVVGAIALRQPGRTTTCAGAAAVAAVAIGITYSRTALLAFVGVVIVLLAGVASQRTRGTAVAVLLAVIVGGGATALLASDGWVGRAQEASTGTNVTRGRGELAGQAFTLIRHHPLVGVGTGRYVLAVEEDEEVAGRSTRDLQPVHAVPLLLVAEGGLAAAAALVLLAVLLVRAAVRAGLAGWLLLLAYLPFLLLDHFPSTFPQGLVMTAAWLGALHVLTGRTPVPAQPPATMAASREPRAKRRRIGRNPSEIARSRRS